MSQLSFNFPFEDCYLDEEFLVSEENSTAFNFISDYNTKNNDVPKIFAICGPNQCGKTHLAHIWQRKLKAGFVDIGKLKEDELTNYFELGQAYIIEDIDLVENQVMLFHIFNIIQERDCHLLITSLKELNQIKYNFADLASRLKNVFHLNIKNPDSNFIKMLLTKKFSDKQLLVEKPVIEYLTKNITRNFEAINQVCKILEFYCFEQKRKITVPLATDALRGISA